MSQWLSTTITITNTIAPRRFLSFSRTLIPSAPTISPLSQHRPNHAIQELTTCGIHRDGNRTIRWFHHIPFTIKSMNIMNRFQNGFHMWGSNNFVTPYQYVSTTLHQQQKQQDFFFSSSSSNTNTTTNEQPKSNRSSFRSIPIHPVILHRIEEIGVGIRSSSQNRHNRRRGKGGGNKPRGKRGRKGSDRLLREDEEDSYFADRRVGNRGGGRGSGGMTESGLSGSGRSSLRWLPPPPFSAFEERTIGIGDEENRSETIRRLPVKILGTSEDDEMPRSTVGLPEIAIAGRSNVGKSTLLNALLYGNLYGDERTNNPPEERKFVRGKTPEQTKLPKGAKAIVSAKPGETKRITFYQLSASSTSSSASTEETTDADSSSTTTTQKLSLVLADLPGYGFAYASDSKKKEWADTMTRFLLHRGDSLKRILLLLDARHGFKKADCDFLEMLQMVRRQDCQDNDNGSQQRDDEGRKGGRGGVSSGRKGIDLPPIQIVLTKCDLVSQKDLARRVVQTKGRLSELLVREPSALPVMLVSAKSGIGHTNIRGGRARGGILELQKELAGLVLRHHVNGLRHHVNGPKGGGGKNKAVR